MNKRRLLIVDDEPELCQSLADQLAHYREFELTLGESAGVVFELIKSTSFDLVIMDVGLPDMDGREVVKIMRQNGFRSPIIMLTAHRSDADEILGLECGANDYITKPFRFSVLLARVRALLRQHDQSEDVVFSVGPFNFRPATKTLESNEGTRIRLTDKEASILKFLYRQGSKTVSREVLLQEVWGYNKRVATHTLETHIYRLRQKIERDPGNARLLVTEEGGYRLVP